MAHCGRQSFPAGKPTICSVPPFLWMAAMHAACVHGQRLAGFVPFPVGFEQRRILAPHQAGRQHHAQVRLCAQAAEMLVYDLLIADAGGRVRDHRLRMRDVSGGRITPPAWIRADAC